MKVRLDLVRCRWRVTCLDQRPHSWPGHERLEMVSPTHATPSVSWAGNGANELDPCSYVLPLGHVYPPLCTARAPAESNRGTPSCSGLGLRQSLVSPGLDGASTIPAFPEPGSCLLTLTRPFRRSDVSPNSSWGIQGRVPIYPGSPSRGSVEVRTRAAAILSILADLRPVRYPACL